MSKVVGGRAGSLLPMIFSIFHSQELRIAGRWQTGGLAHRHVPRLHYPHPTPSLGNRGSCSSFWMDKDIEA